MEAVGNTNCVFAGEFLQGTAKGNTNCRLNLRNSVLNLLMNTNCQLSGQDANLALQHTTNARVSGTGNRGKLEKEVNVQIEGDHNEMDLAKNTNLAIRGSDNLLNIRGTVNTKVVADHNNLDVAGVTNHHFFNSAEQGFPGSNFVHLSIGGSSFRSSHGFFDRMSQVFHGSSAHTVSSAGYATPSINYKIGYLNKATVQTTKYEVGLFSFFMKQQGNKVHVDLDDNHMDELLVTKKSETEVQVVGAKNSVKQKLVFEAPESTRIEEPKVNSFIIHLPVEATPSGL